MNKQTKTNKWSSWCYITNGTLKMTWCADTTNLISYRCF